MEELDYLAFALNTASHKQRILLFGWHLHIRAKKSRFMPSEIEALYSAQSYAPPSGFGGYFKLLRDQGHLLKDKAGYFLENGARRKLDELHGASEATIKVRDLLTTLPQKVPNLDERTYLNEALICYRHCAFRAAIVMTWNLAYHHLCSYVLAHRLSDFNARWLISYPGQHKRAVLAINGMDDFGRELKESEVIEICKAANIVTADMARILSEKLGRRNSAAHPSSVSIAQLQVDAFIDDLVTNVVLKLV